MEQFTCGMFEWCVSRGCGNLMTFPVVGEFRGIDIPKVGDYVINSSPALRLIVRCNECYYRIEIEYDLESQTYFSNYIDESVPMEELAGGEPSEISESYDQFGKFPKY